MRLLIVSDTFTPDVNGVARSLRHFAIGLQTRGHHVEIVTTRGDPADPLPRHVVNSFPLPGYWSIRLGFATRGWFLELIDKVRPDVLYIATETVLGIAAILAARTRGLAIVSGFHTNFQSYAQDYHLSALQPAAEALLRLFHNQTHLTLAPSAHTAARLHQMGIDNVEVVGRGVNTDHFKPHSRSDALRLEWGADARTPVAVYVGRVAAEKNLALLEQAFATFLQTHPKGRCVVVGAGPMLEQLRASQPDWVFLGEKQGEELARCYASADLFLFPSLSETFGNVVIEALASGLVVVAYDYAAAHEHVSDGVNGLLAPFGSEPVFLEKVRQASLGWSDTALREAARCKAQSLSWASQVELFETYLQSAIDRFAYSPLCNDQRSVSPHGHARGVVASKASATPPV